MHWVMVPSPLICAKSRTRRNKRLAIRGVPRDQLEVMDVNDIAQHYQDVDLIIASDVLAYMGNLQPIFNSFFSVLRPGGLLAFSVESTTLPDYILQTTVRYAHNKAYLQSTLEKSGFEWLSCQEHVIRTQQKQPVNGYLVVAGK